MLPIRVDCRDQVRQGLVPLPGDLLQAAPEPIFKADAGLVTGNGDRMLFHGCRVPERAGSMRQFIDSITTGCISCSHAALTRWAYVRRSAGDDHQCRTT